MPIPQQHERLTDQVEVDVAVLDHRRRVRSRWGAQPDRIRFVQREGVVGRRAQRFGIVTPAAAKWLEPDGIEALGLPGEQAARPTAIGPTPRARSARRSRTVTYVLPTLVSVPVIKTLIRRGYSK